MIAVVEALAKSALHVVLTTLGNIPTSGIPEPLEAVLGAVAPLSPEVVGHVGLQRFERLDLVVVEELQKTICRSCLQLRHHHAPRVVESLNVVSSHFETLKVVQVVQDLAAIA